MMKDCKHKILNEELKEYDIYGGIIMYCKECDSNIFFLGDDTKRAIRQLINHETIPRPKISGKYETLYDAPVFTSSSLKSKKTNKEQMDEYRLKMKGIDK